jgi:hypothetical protein
MSTKDSEGREVVHREELDARLDTLKKFTEDQAAKIRRANATASYTTAPEPPDIDDLLTDALRKILEDDVIPASYVEQGINEREMQAELMKKALVGLKGPILRDIARERNIKSSGPLEELATRIASIYHWDASEIADLVRSFEVTPPVITGHTSYLYGLESLEELSDIERRLQYVLSRYVRIGLAKWFSFDSVVTEDRFVDLRGTLHAYQTHIDDSDESARFVAEPSESTARALIVEDAEVMQVRNATSTAARAVIDALELTTGVKTLDFVPQRGTVSAELATLSRISLFVLDVIYTRLAALSYGQPNLTVVRFKMLDRDPLEQENDRPVLKTVRFDGNHVLDSVPTCRLLMGGRDLTEVSMSIRSKPRTDGEFWTFPVRLTVEKDHVSVVTGYGAGAPIGQSSSVHEDLVRVVTEEIVDGIADPARLEELIRRVSERAQSGRETEEANILRSDT